MLFSLHGFWCFWLWSVCTTSSTNCPIELGIFQPWILGPFRTMIFSHAFFFPPSLLNDLLSWIILEALSVFEASSCVWLGMLKRPERQGTVTREVKSMVRKWLLPGCISFQSCLNSSPLWPDLCYRDYCITTILSFPLLTLINMYWIPQIESQNILEYALRPSSGKCICAER